MRKAAALLPILAFVSTADLVVAQGWQSSVAPQPAPKAKMALPQRAKAVPASQKPPPDKPLQAQTQFLVRTTLLALNDANRTGNYTVLRDLAAPSFRERNSAADLAHVFAELRRVKLDLSMAALLLPDIEEPPLLDKDRRLRLKGSYPTAPNRIVFDILFEAVGGQWQLHSLSIATRPMRAAAGGPLMR